MKTKPKSYPYPVLSPLSDDVSPNTFDSLIAVTARPEAYVLRVELQIGNPTLLALVGSGKAKYSLHVECQSNFYRKLFQSEKAVQEIPIPADEVSGVVEVAAFITAAEAIDGYRIEGAHADYTGLAFPVRPGDILAVSKTATFEAEKDYDSLQKISSVMQIQPSESVAEGFIETDYEANDRITVFLSKSDHQRYGLLRESAGIRGVIIQTISLPVLIEAVAILREQEPQDSEGVPRWQRRIRHKLSAVAPDWETSEKSNLHFAQLLLSSPFGRCVTELLQVTEGK
jgi:hypothetical protein